MFFKYNIWGLLWLLIIFVASATPGEQLPPSPFFDFDKLVHLGIYGVLQLLLLRGFSRQNQFITVQKNYLIFSFLLSATYGMLMEVLQGYAFRNRSFDWYDGLANIAGVIVATILWKFFMHKKLETRR